MRLLDTDRIELTEFGDDSIPPYAILSHTWEQEEVTFQDMEQGRAGNMKGYDKVKNSCSVARKNGYDYIWIDACCIDKSSSAELSEAINSMYRWYQEAEVCYAYLADISSVSQFTQSRWFTRGWTLQELVAPSNMVFFDKDWKGSGTKASLRKSISERTRIPQAILDGTKHLEITSVAQRMSWAAGRKTTRIEDQAYCLMGIFGINMPLLYGEGVKAFLRLQEEIMKVSDDHSLFAWRHPKPASSSGGLLAVSPDAFKHSGSIIPWNLLTPYNSPLTITNKGVHLDAPFIAQGPRGVGLIILHCTEIGKQNHLIGVYLRDSFLTMEYFERCMPEELRLVNLQQFSPSQYPTRSLCIRLRDHANLWRAVSPSQELRPMHPEDKLLRSVMSGNKEDKSPEQRLSHAASKGDEDGVRRLLALPNIQVDFKDGEGRTPLSFAAEAGNGRIVKLLLNFREVDINSKDSNGSSPLAYASARGHEDVVWLLLGRSDIAINTTDIWGRTVLSLAARGGHVALVSQLLSRRDTRTYLIDGKGQSVLFHAAEKGHAAIVKLLLSSGKIHPDLKDQEGRSALWRASKNGHESIVKMLLETGWVDPTSKDKYGISALWHAASNGHGPVVKLLRANHVDIEVKDAYGRTPLCQASANGHVDVVRQLLHSGADIKTSDLRDGTVLWYATEGGHEAIVELLLGCGASLGVRDGSSGMDLSVESRRLLRDEGADPEAGDLWVAAAAGRETTVRLLLLRASCSQDKHLAIAGAVSIAIKNKHGSIARLLIKSADDPSSVIRHDALLWTTMNRDEPVARLLIDNGVYVNEIYYGWEVLQSAARSNCKAIIETLIGGLHEYTDMVDAVRNQGTVGVSGRFRNDLVSQAQSFAQMQRYSALWCAVMNGDDILVELFLGRGARVEETFKDDKTVLFHAVSAGHGSIVRQLLMKGANREAKDRFGKTPLMYAAEGGIHL